MTELGKGFEEELIELGQGFEIGSQVRGESVGELGRGLERALTELGKGFEEELIELGSGFEAG